MSKGKESKKGLAGTLFTAAMIVCCLLLYFAGGTKTNENVVNIGVGEATATEEPEAKAERIYPTAEVFFERATAFGFNAEAVEKEGYAPALGYSLQRKDLNDAELVLSLRNGGVCAFTLNVPVPKDAGELPEDPTPIELSLYEQRAANAELAEAWLEKGLGALLSAMDIMEEITYGDKTSMYSMMLKTMDDDKDRNMKAGSVAFTVSTLEKTEEKWAAISVDIAED